MRETYQSGVNDSFEGGETVVEGAENGDDVVEDLTLLHRLYHNCHSLTQRIHATTTPISPSLSVDGFLHLSPKLG